MSKQTFQIGKNFIPNILVLSSSAVLALFAALILIAPVAETTSAVDTPNLTDGLSLVTNKTIEANIRPEENGSLSIIKDTIVGSTNSQYGYEVYISANSDTETSIYLNGNPENDAATQKILATTGTYNAPVALDLTNGATWGYAIAGLDNFDASYNIYTPAASAKFAAMPTMDNKQLIHSSSTAVADDTLDIYYGIDADGTLEPGIYKTEILYTALPIIPPSTPKAILGDNGNLNLVYDYSTYTVGDTYTDNLGSTEIVEVFNIPADGAIENGKNIAYSQKDSIESINIEASFQDFEPSTVNYWFNEMRYVTSVTNIENLNTSQAESAEFLFYYLGSEVSTLDMGNVKLMDFSNLLSARGMFYGVGYKVIDLSLNLDNMDFENVTTMQDIFDNFGFEATNITLSLKNWNVPNLTNLYMGFYDLGDFSDGGTVYIDVSGWVLGSLQNLRNAFYCVGYRASSLTLVGLSDWDVSTVNNAAYAFCSVGRENDSLELTIENWNLGTSGGLNAEWMFYNLGYGVRGDVILNFSGWSFGYINTDHMFAYTGGGTHTKLQADFSDWTFSGGSLASMFYDFGSSSGQNYNFQLDVTGWDLGNVSILNNLFYDSGYGASSYVITGLSTWDVSKITSMEGMFNNNSTSATTWNIGDIGGWDTKNVTNMSGMFNDAGYNATTWDIGDISGWIVSNVTNHSNFISLNSNSTNASVVNNQPAWQ